MVQIIKVADLAVPSDAAMESMVRNSGSGTRKAISDIFGPSVAEQMADDATIAAAAVDAMSDAAVQAQLAWGKGRPNTNINVRDLPPGVFTLSSSAIAGLVSGLPETYPGTLKIDTNKNEIVRSHEFHPHDATYYWVQHTKTGSTVTEWIKVEGSLLKGRLMTTSGAFALQPGFYTLSSLTYVDMVANLPERWPGTLEVKGNPGQIVNAMVYWPYQRDYHWEVNSYGASWGSWRKVEAGSGSPAVARPAAQHAGQQGAFAFRRGGKVGTGGKRALAFRFDHGLVNFRDLVLPHMIRLGLPWSMAMNSASSRWSMSESSGVTPADLDRWAREHGGEVWNHGATHTDATTLSAMTAEIVTAKDDLQALLPGVPIEGYVVPGVSGTGLGGFGAGETPAQWDTDAGRLILGHHGVSTSHLGDSPTFAITGPRAIVPRHFGVDSRTAAASIAGIDAIPAGHGMVLFLHPSQLNLTGQISVSSFVQVLEHVAAQRDAGNLEVLTMGGLALADAESSWRDEWLSVAAAVSAPWSSTVSADRWRAAKGAPRLLVGELSGSGNAVLSAALGSTTLASRTIAATATWTRFVMPFTVPLNTTSSAALTVALSGAGTQVRNVRLINA